MQKYRSCIKTVIVLSNKCPKGDCGTLLLHSELDGHRCTKCEFLFCCTRHALTEDQSCLKCKKYPRCCECRQRYLPSFFEFCVDCKGELCPDCVEDCQIRGSPCDKGYKNQFCGQCLRDHQKMCKRCGQTVCDGTWLGQDKHCKSCAHRSKQLETGAEEPLPQKKPIPKRQRTVLF